MRIVAAERPEHPGEFLGEKLQTLRIAAETRLADERWSCGLVYPYLEGSDALFRPVSNTLQAVMALHGKQLDFNRFSDGDTLLRGRFEKAYPDESYARLVGHILQAIPDELDRTRAHQLITLANELPRLRYLQYSVGYPPPVPQEAQRVRGSIIQCTEGSEMSIPLVDADFSPRRKNERPSLAASLRNGLAARLEGAAKGLRVRVRHY